MNKKSESNLKELQLSDGRKVVFVRKATGGDWVQAERYLGAVGDAQRKIIHIASLTIEIDGIGGLVVEELEKLGLEDYLAILGAFSELNFTKANAKLLQVSA